MTRLARRVSATLLARGTALALALTLLVEPAAASASPDASADRLLERAVEATRERSYVGDLVVASFSSQGPQVTRMEVTATPDGSLRLARAGGWELGRTGEQGFLKQSDRLLRIGGTERLPFDLDRLRRKYELTIGAERQLDTGPAAPLVVREHAAGTVREVLYVDADTRLIVRRETYNREGDPVRVVAFTRLEVAEWTVVAPDDEGLDVEDHRRAAADVTAFREGGFLVPDQLPHGFELLGHYEVEDARVPTLHLVYGDGLYTLSLFQQQGRLSLDAVKGAERISTDEGGTVWRWPGSEPRRVVWTGNGLTFTALTDAPVDEVLAVVGGMPADPSPSFLDRLTRGLARLGRWLVPGDGER